MPRKRIIVLGAGFGGLRTSLQLAKKLKKLSFLDRYEVVLIDRNQYHTYTPLLYEVATTSKKTADLCALREIAAYSVPHLVENLPITFVQGEIASADIAHGELHLNGKRKLECDYLVLALGSETNFYGIPGLKERALTLKTLVDAIRIRDTIWNLAMVGKEAIEVVVGGGGSTGVELSGELKAWCGELEGEFSKCRLRVRLIQGPPTILNGFDKKVAEKAGARLRAVGVEIITGARIAAVEDHVVLLEDGRKIPSDVFIWAGGVKATDIIARLPLKSEAQSRVTVIGDMECLPQTSDLKLHTRVYAIGDNVCLYDPKTGKPIPSVARAAISQGNIAAHNIVEEIKKTEDPAYQPRVRAYQPREYPYVIPIGGKWAIAKVGPLIIQGFAGWVLKGLVELNYLLSIMAAGRALRIWLRGLSIFIKNDRLG